MTDLPSPLPPPTGAPATPAGWYPDPIRGYGWRWWDGVVWTAYRFGKGKKPFLPNWLSWPVVVCGIPVVLLLAWSGFSAPIQSLAALVPGAIAIPVFVWLDRVEPEPWTSRIHAVLWGATVAIAGAAVVNSLVFVTAGQTAGLVISAPIVEETLKGLGLFVAVRRRELNSATDGVVFAGLIAMGFAMVEDIEYFISAQAIGNFGVVFILRAILTPFAHPLFTMWTGLAVGRKVGRTGRVDLTVLWGLLVAIALHAGWNSVGLAVDNGEQQVVVALLAFVALFVVVAATLVWVRVRERKRFDRIAPQLVQRFGLSQQECIWFSSVDAALSTRRQLPRSARKPFDAMRSAIARLAAVQGRSDAAELEAVYASDLYTERHILNETLGRQPGAR